MAILKILKYPHPVLREKASPINLSDEAYVAGELQTLIDDMIETMYASPGAVGLAASQIGKPLRLFVMDLGSKTRLEDPDSSQLKVLINPVITEQSRNKTVREGCLSFPEFLANVKRATKLTYEAYDRFGVKQTYQVRDFEAVAVQHELDHLDGVLMIDRVNSLKTDLIRRGAQPLVD